MEDARLRARQCTREHGEDIPEVADWTWADSVTGSVRGANVGVGQLSVASSTGGDDE
ncbi:hypothetical protein [Clavibacter sp. VKM Ac-2873]|uniref:hypothetical protein n=1 Tax=Clavibacter sp. VKM Ac-2873 TaxID=2783813 RepID=UPI00351C0D1D